MSEFDDRLEEAGLAARLAEPVEREPSGGHFWSRLALNA